MRSRARRLDVATVVGYLQPTWQRCVQHKVQTSGSVPGSSWLEWCLYGVGDTQPCCNHLDQPAARGHARKEPSASGQVPRQIQIVVLLDICRYQPNTTPRSMVCHICSAARLIQSPWHIPTLNPPHFPPSPHAATTYHSMVSSVSRKVHRELYSSSAVICAGNAISQLQTSRAASNKADHAAMVRGCTQQLSSTAISTAVQAANRVWSWL